VPINDFAIANEELAKSSLEKFYPCCGKSICEGCIYSFVKSENIDKCPFCNSDLANKTEEEEVEDILKRVAVNDPNALCVLADRYEYGEKGFPQDRTKAMELYARAVDLGFSGAHYNLGVIYHEGGNLKKAKFHSEAAAMAGHDEARYNIGAIEANSGNMERANKHWMIAASAGSHNAMQNLQHGFELGVISRKSIDSTLTAYNSSCAKMRSEARDACIHCQLTRL
jgi:TPR repeat protein